VGTWVPVSVPLPFTRVLVGMPHTKLAEHHAFVCSSFYGTECTGTKFPAAGHTAKAGTSFHCVRHSQINRTSAFSGRATPPPVQYAGSAQGPSPLLFGFPLFMFWPCAWPWLQALSIFETSLRRGNSNESRK